jgi:predicted nucleic acid-binding protein
MIVDTSVFIETERRNLQALERLNQLMEEGSVVVSAVTVVELLASPTLAAGRKGFYEAVFATQCEVLPVSVEAAFMGVAAAHQNGGGMPADILIAGTAIEHGLKVVTFDAGLARLMGSQAELLRRS